MAVPSSTCSAYGSLHRAIRDFTKSADEPVFDDQSSDGIAKMALFSVIKWPSFRLTKTGPSLGVQDIVAILLEEAPVAARWAGSAGVPGSTTVPQLFRWDRPTPVVYHYRPR